VQARAVNTALNSLVIGIGITSTRKNSSTLTIHLFFMVFSFQFHEAPTMLVLKIYQTVFMHELCEHSL